jgi:hypothetical protein
MRGMYINLPTASLQMICGMIVMTMLAAATDIIDLPPNQPLLEAEMSENFIQQLKIILSGATRLDDELAAGKDSAQVPPIPAAYTEAKE